MIFDALRAFRPHHWVKNLFVFIPLVFTRQWGSLVIWERTTIAFIAFCAIASAGYLVNDILDREKDQLHPTKKQRPIAAGKISPKQGYSLAVALFFIALILASALSVYNGLIIVGYALLMFCYSRGLKRLPIIDLLVIGFGFVLRILAGAFSIEAKVSIWVIACTICVAFLLGLGKRIAESHYTKGTQTRSTLGFYTINRTVWLERIFSVASVLLYTGYVVRVHPTLPMFLSIVLVIVGLWRFSLQLTRLECEGPTELILKDRWLQLIGIGWLILSIIGLTWR